MGLRFINCVDCVEYIDIGPLPYARVIMNYMSQVLFFIIGSFCRSKNDDLFLLHCFLFP